MDKIKYKFSCVLDFSPIMVLQAKIWLKNLLWIDVEPSDIYIHVIGNMPDVESNFFISKGINIIFKEPYDLRNKYCNKLVQLETFESKEDYDYVFLMDCDTAVISLEGLEFKGNVFAKIVDYPNPPIEILEKIFQEAHLDFKIHESTYEWEGRNLTEYNNCNGGVYIFSNRFLKKISPEWKKYASWGIDNASIFTEKYNRHADQVGFALAMAALYRRVSHLGNEWNFPIHLPVKTQEVVPKILHFHNKVTREGKLTKTGSLAVDAQIELINDRIISG